MRLRMAAMDNIDNIIIHDKAEEAGIEGNIKIDNEVIQSLTPSSYLKNLGLTLEQRLENLLLLVKANLKPRNTDAPDEKTFYLPFTLLHGPFVREDIFSVLVELSGDGTSRVITIHKAQSDDDK